MLRYLLALAVVLLASPAHAQDKATAIRCNANVTGTTSASGNTLLVASPTLGAIFVCGYSLNLLGAPTTATLGYGTSTTAAVFTSITQAWALATATMGTPVATDPAAAFRGIYIPPGNALLLNLATTGQIGYSVYYFQENTNR